MCDSTGTLARECATSSGVAGPLAVYTFHQTKGKGQGNNIWESEPGKNLACTFMLELPDHANPIFWNKAITLAVRETLSRLAQTGALIKWPNDIFVENKKISGLLLETYSGAEGKRFLSAGIGINVNQVRWLGNFDATSLALTTGKLIPIIDVLHELAYNIRFYINKIEKNELDAIQAEYNAHLWHLGEQVTLEDPAGNASIGTLKAVDEAGRIIIQTAGGSEAFHHGTMRIKK